MRSIRIETPETGAVIGTRVVDAEPGADFSGMIERIKVDIDVEKAIVYAKVYVCSIALLASTVKAEFLLGGRLVTRIVLEDGEELNF